MARFGFCGGTYQDSNLSADAQECIGWYPERDEGAGGKSDLILQPRDGLQTFSLLSSDNSVPSLFKINSGSSGERCFSVGGGGTFYEIFADGTTTSRGSVAPSTAAGQMAANQTQILILSNGNLYIFTLGTNVLTAALTYTDSSAIPPIASIGQTDGYFFAQIANTNKFQISNLLDGTKWDTIDVAQVLYFPDNIVSMVCHDHRDVIFQGDKQSVFYYNTGNPDFPFAPVPGAFMEMGSNADLGVTKLDNTVFFVAKDERGALTGQRLNGYNPTRITTHAVEQAWQSYSTTSDIVTYAFQSNGHVFWRVYFPTANVTWDFDVASGMWSKPLAWDAAHGVYTAHRSQCHAYAFGKHLVGDWGSGKIYWMDKQFTSDDGSPIRRVRRAPYVARENRWAFFNQLEIEGDWGNGPSPPLTDGMGNPRPPQLMLNWSNDRGKTWSDEIILSSGFQGEYAKRMIARRLGKCWGTVGRVFQVATSDPVPWRLTDAYLDADPEYKSQERLAVQLRKTA